MTEGAKALANVLRGMGLCPLEECDKYATLIDKRLRKGGTHIVTTGPRGDAVEVMHHGTRGLLVPLP